jgi:hypothetical protein
LPQFKTFEPQHQYLTVKYAVVQVILFYSVKY